MSLRATVPTVLLAALMLLWPAARVAAQAPSDQAYPPGTMPVPVVPVPGMPGAVPGALPVDPFIPWAMSVMAPAFAMMDPNTYAQFSAMMVNPWVDQMTKHRVLEAMMKGFDPAWMGGRPPGVEPEMTEGGVPKNLPLAVIPGFPTQTRQDFKPNTVTPGVDLVAKRRFYQSMMMASPLSMRDMVGVMAHKLPVAEDVSFEDAVESMKLRANEVNFKFVGHSPLWKDVAAITGDEDTPRIEIFQFCDAMVGRKILDYVPEFAVFLPCRIVLLEDGDGKLWVMTLDWDVSWLDYAQNPNSILDQELRADAKRIRDAMAYIMEGAATGDF